MVSLSYRPLFLLFLAVGWVKCDGRDWRQEQTAKVSEERERELSRLEKKRKRKEKGTILRGGHLSLGLEASSCVVLILCLDEWTLSRAPLYDKKIKPHRTVTTDSSGGDGWMDGWMDSRMVD